MANKTLNIGLVNSINRFAEAEGWAIFDLREIQKDDEAGVFIDDEEAVSFVRGLAANGSELHKTALALHNGEVQS